MKILLGYSYYESPVDVAATVSEYVARLTEAGYEVESYPLTLNPPGSPIWWIQLDKLWKLGDKQLLEHYNKLANKLVTGGFDVFLNFNGINIHPEFVRQIPAFTVYCCNDDPESSDRLSKPVAAAYDLCMIGNIAALDDYKSWGAKEVRFWPMSFMASEYDPTLTEDKILNGERDVDISILCEKLYVPDRVRRLNIYSQAFPAGKYYGPGWENPYLADKVPLYQRTKIGPNFHNSTGPINTRTYMLPANGIMQLCDNKKHLGLIFELNKEVVGFDTVEEAIELTHYYLAHDDERRKIAAAGWKRSVTEYNELTVFGWVEKYVNEVKPELKPRNLTFSPEEYLKQHRKGTTLNRLGYAIKNKFIKEYYPQN